MIKVNVRKGQSIEKAISIFKKKVKESGLMLEIKNRRFYEKPSLKRREQKNKARLRQKYRSIKENTH
jgi:small subunit ribosomal protein S21|tara:strand:+ start:610 stop:810 length:201 start_codon:yes stop_codon:yes gene_type:complete